MLTDISILNYKTDILKKSKQIFVALLENLNFKNLSL